VLNRHTIVCRAAGGGPGGNGSRSRGRLRRSAAGRLAPEFPPIGRKAA